MNKWVTREYHRGKWVNNYFNESKPAKKLMKKIMSRGSVAICLRASL